MAAMRHARGAVRLAKSSGTSCFQASTASTANSGSVCSHARMASATPCATKNCADSAAQAMSMEAARIDGAVHSTLSGETFLNEPDTGLLLYHGMFFKLGYLLGIVGAEVRPPALPPCQRTPRDQQWHSGVYLFKFGASFAESFAVAHNPTPLP